MTEIKPMETVYKGFRFRSRLECRWAMFFDRIGIKWDFEPQPLLINGEPYLPDFNVKSGPLGQLYHEVKAAYESERIKPVKVYLAGKMGWKYNWHGCALTRQEGGSWEIETANINDILFVCTGPFETGCSHGLADDYRGDPHWNVDREQNTLQNCLGGIGDADIICAHISTPDAYGTIAEIGYAYSNLKKISLTIDASVLKRAKLKDGRSGQPGRHDLWFIEEMASAHAVVNGVEEAREFHSKVISSLTSREYQMIAGVGAKHAAVMTFGDPLDVGSNKSELSFLGAHLSHLCAQNIGVAQEIRAHRFDRR